VSARTRTLSQAGGVPGRRGRTKEHLDTKKERFDITGLGGGKKSGEQPLAKGRKNPDPSKKPKEKAALG